MANEDTNAPAVSSRRGFLKQAGATVAAVAFVGIGGAGVLKDPHFPSMAESSGAILVDPTLCIGCLTCEVACSDVHKEAGMSSLPRIRIYSVDNVKVSAEVEKQFGKRGTFQQQVCLQCPDAPCLPVCPVDSLHVDDKTQARVIDNDTCIACGKCEASCIFPSLDEAVATGKQVLHQKSRISYDDMLEVYTKCDLCYFREEGPACVQKCPVNIAIKDKKVSSSNMCLDVSPRVSGDTFEKLRKGQTAAGNRKEMQA
ncbi:MAG TPA: 4Fe-4S dicluster domain-containing protein [Dehalococcoidia bacterium]|jgi:Fe-S-cluster-containing hydrogenase component 2